MSSCLSTKYSCDGISVECASVGETLSSVTACQEMTEHSISIWLKSAPSQVILTRPPPSQAPKLTPLLHPYHFEQSCMPCFSQTCLLMGRPPCAPAAQAWTVFPPDAASTLRAADKSPTCSQEAQTPFTDTVEAKFPPSGGRIYTIFNAPCRLLSDLGLALHNPM